MMDKISLFYKDITFDSLSDANFLDTLYSNIPLKLKNKKNSCLEKYPQ